MKPKLEILRPKIFPENIIAGVTLRSIEENPPIGFTVKESEFVSIELAEKNKTILAEAIGVSPNLVKYQTQTHGVEVQIMNNDSVLKESDAMITNISGIVLAVKIADCGAILLYDSVNTQTGWNAFNARLTMTGSLCQNGCYFDDQNTDYANYSQATYISHIILNACSSSSCPDSTLNYNSSTGKYGYAPGVSSGFTRKIQTSVASGVDETNVTSTVTWKQGSSSYTITFSEALFNWME